MKPGHLSILYEDDNFLAVDKPAGILTIPDRFDSTLPSIVSLLSARIENIIPVHRLDRFTSGVNLFAKNAEAHKALSLAFEGRDVEKYYMALTDGIPHPASGRIEVALAESSVQRGKMLVHPRGKMAVTDYKILETYNNIALVYLRIHTGRMHQIRVHMQYIGTPLLVDPLYGRREAWYLSEVKTKKFRIGKDQDEKPLLNRQPLHACKIVIPHPVTQAPITIESELPRDMKAVLQQLKKWTTPVRPSL